MELAALDANYLDANRLFVSGAKGGEYLERHDVAIVCCGLPERSLNWAFLKPAAGDLAATAAASRAYFEGRKLPFQLTFRDPELAPAHALAPHGWKRREDPVPGMALPLPAAAIPPVPEGLTIEEVATREQLALFRETAFRGFGYPPQVAPRFLNDRLLTLPNVRMYAGAVAGEVVATSVLVTTGTVAGIYWVGTLDAHRRRGYGEALTWAAVAAGQRAGCTVASLQASAIGKPVYERMGFAQVLQYEHLLPDA
jgi:ribosomal protein S18 acetylase RimI-like enzyme